MNRSPRIVAVVEDETHMRKALARLLTSHDCRVETYAHGAELLTGVESIPFDCIILDLHMPELNGFDLMAVMQARGMRVPVVAITGRDEPDLMSRVRALGADSVLLKPVDQESLLVAIDRAIDGNPNVKHPATMAQGEHQ